MVVCYLTGHTISSSGGDGGVVGGRGDLLGNRRSRSCTADTDGLASEWWKQMQINSLVNLKRQTLALAGLQDML